MWRPATARRRRRPARAYDDGPSDFPRSLTRAAKTYFTIRIWSAPFALGNYVVLGWLIGRARAMLALIVQIAINLINMVATMLLVLVFDAGIAGAAIAASMRG